MLKLAWKYMRYYKSQTLAIFASILLTAALLSGISSLIYSSQKNDLANSKTIYGDWHYYIETDPAMYETVQSGEQEEGYILEKCGKMEIKDVVSEEFLICFIKTDETYRQMAHRGLLEGTCCIYRSLFTQKAFDKSSNERGYLFYEKKEDLRSPSG